MAYSNYRRDWNRDLNQRSRFAGDRDPTRDQQFSQRDEERDEERDDYRAREAMERDYYGAEGRGGYVAGGWRGADDQGQRGYGRGDYRQEYRQDYGPRYGQDYGQSGRDGRH